MARRTETADDEWDDADEGPSGADVSDVDDADADVDTIDCPHCGAAVYEGAEQCPRCGRYLVDEEVRRRRPMWVIVTAVVCVVAFLFWAF